MNGQEKSVDSAVGLPTTSFGDGILILIRAGIVLALAPFIYACCRLRRANVKPCRTDANPTSLDVLYVQTDLWHGRLNGGALAHIVGLWDGFAKLNHRVRVVSGERLTSMVTTTEMSVLGMEENPKGIPLSVSLVAYNLTFLWRALPLLRQKPPDLIYQRHCLLNISGAILSMIFQVPLMLEYNSPVDWRREAEGSISAGLIALRRAFERINLARASRILVVSDVLREILVQRGASPFKVIVNPNGAKVETFSPDLDGGEVRQRLGVLNRFVVAFSGYYGPYHGVEYLARATRYLIGECPEIVFLFIGDERLRNVVSRIGAEEETLDRMIFLEDVPFEEMPRHLAACDVLVSPHVNMADGSRFFGSPIKLFEYMATGKPIVASRIEQLGQLLIHERDALLVEPGNAQGIAEAILRLWREPRLRSRLGTAAREKCVNNYTWAHNARRVIEGYTSLVGRR